MSHGTTNHMPGSRTSIGSAKSSRQRRLIEVSLPGMLRRNIPPVLFIPLVIGIVLASLWLLFNRSVGVEEQVALEFDASSPQIVLAPSESYQQRFEATQLALRGFVIYLPSEHRPGKITVRVVNTATEKSVMSYRYTTTVRGDSQRLTFLLPHLATNAKDSLVATITNEGSDTLLLQSHQPGIIAFSTLQPVEPAIAFQGGLLAAIAFGLLILLLELLPRKVNRWWLTRGVIVFLPLLATPGFWFTAGPLGVGDWDYRFSLHEIYRRIIVSFHQFPFWNPYTCGGTGGLSDPEFSVLSPTFLLELLFGVPFGTQMAIYLGLSILGLGMINLAKSLGLTWRGALVAAIVATHSSAFILKVVEGHVTIIYAFMWVPWILWAWRNAYYRHLALPSSPRLRPANFYINDGPPDGYAARKGSQVANIRLLASPWIILGGMFMALAFYQGGIYVLTYTILALALLGLLIPQRLHALKVTLLMAVWCLGFSALKLLPVLYWLMYFPDAHYVSSTATLSHVTDIFFRRHMHGSYVLPGQLSGWHEYGAYLGYVVLAVSGIAVASWRRSRMVPTLIFLSVIAIGVASLGPQLKFVFDYIPFIPRSNISRVNLFTVVAVAVLAGIGIDRLYRHTTARRILWIVVASLVAFDLFSYSAMLSDQTFVLPTVFPAPSAAAFPLAYSDEHYTLNKNGNEYYRSYPMTLAGYGSFSFCSVLGPTPHVAKVVQDTVPPLVSSAHGTATLVRWSPNTITVRYGVPAYSHVVINMNYAPGWKVNGHAAKKKDGLLAAEVPAGSGQLHFEYRAPLFWPGAIISIVSVMIALFFVLRSRRYGS